MVARTLCSLELGGVMQDDVNRPKISFQRIRSLKCGDLVDKCWLDLIGYQMHYDDVLP